MQNILIIGYVWPEPDSSAAGSRMMQLIKLFLAQDWQITFASAAADSPHRADLESLGVAVRPIALNCSSFDTFVTELQPDMVLFDRFMIEEQFAWRVAQHCPKAIRVLDTEDLHSLRAARHQALKQQRPVQPADLHNDLAIREVAAILRCDLTLMIADYEHALLVGHYRVDPRILLQLPFMLPPAPSSTLPGFDERCDYISIGNFRHAPNWDAVRHLKDTLWPLIRARQADAQLYVYGAYPPPKATALHNPKQGFHVAGWAENAQAVMRRARLCLAPLRFGAGLKGKLIDAMQCGTPNVSTTVAAEGMSAGLAWSGTIADDPTQFAEAAVKLYKDPVAWQHAQQAGFAIINQGFAEAPLGQRLLQRLSELEANLSEHREHNFIGAMLRHQSLQSTRYMAQWIEAKNRLAETQESGTPDN